LETSISYITQLHQLGYKKFICTPHIYKEFYPNSSDTILPALQLVQSKLRELNMDVEIVASAEYMMDSDFEPLLKSDEILPLPNKHILIEMSYMFESMDMAKYIFDLRIKGYTPILAHPERYNYYHNNYEKFASYKDMGCLLQLNLLSATGYYGKEIKITALRLLKDNMFDLIGTDFHSMNHMKALLPFIQSGDAYELFGNYPFKNQELFG
jgi:tyrosine-protein phosphatase YwqE